MGDERMEKTKVFVSWEEVLISNEKGRREVHYYLKRLDGGSELAVVGKEKSVRHMFYAVPNVYLRSLRPHSSLKWRSRREVIDWLSTLVTDSDYSLRVERLDDEDPHSINDSGFKDLTPGKLKHKSIEFSWVGTPLIGRKKRKHYPSFCRNGIKISVHDFVHVMAEDNKRLVAYLEDLYEDSRANRMVVVRWFHKIDEVGLILPSNHNDREIFFSLCQQDLSVECIDGLATVLNRQHFEKFLNEAMHTLCEPYMCCRQFDNYDVKPFDITQVKGYWKQELLRYMYSPRSSSLKSSSPDDRSGDGLADAVRNKPRRRLVCKSGARNLHPSGFVGVPTTGSVKCNGSAVGDGMERLVSSIGEGGFATGPTATLQRRLVVKHKPQQQYVAGSSVELLSQDSGIRGCWFRCVVLKRHGDKLKVRYENVLDADEAGNLEEWVLASRIAKPDELGLRMSGRSAVRPCPPMKGGVSMVFDVGSAVDAWWHDGWWEGIVLQREPDDKYLVFFPGERRSSAFSSCDLRRSLEWQCNRWHHLKERRDIATSILSDQGLKSTDKASMPQVGVSDKQSRDESNGQECGLWFSPIPCSEPMFERSTNCRVRNLAEDDSLSQLTWKSSKKRRTSTKVGFSRKRLCDGGSGSSSSSQEDDDGLSPCNRFLIPKSLKVDHDNCKFEGPLFASPISTLSSLVMSQ